MEAVDECKPANEFQEDVKDPLLEIPLSDSQELWLIQWPDKQLHHEGQLATFESSSGMSYEMVIYASQEPDATVFLSSASEAKIAGNISCCVSLVRYPELSELEEKAKEAKEKAKAERSAQQGSRALSTVLTPSKSSGGRRGILPAISGMSRGKLLGSGEPSSKHPKKRRVNEPTRRISPAVNLSGGHGSGVTTTSSGSAGSSRSENSKKKKTKEET
ncbi:hypothetical protein MKW92_009933 [Papaver armeniacum]|nr:hypothetical protein MKW92_009933 [Papaver armeniacum]